VRPDLADVRLADRIFAPHYAEAVPRRLAAATTLRAGRDPSSETLATLADRDPFDLLDVIGDDAWGVAPGRGLVGYIPAATLAP
jgi:hypothetical protein